ncbi:MAG: type 4a pilus biogenesis protein PilO [Candidatus Omnitrophica bacterium]|nr:type 4a pilus biogenesis protein PilO [Candidatus Omnitrophota bacterium]
MKIFGLDLSNKKNAMALGVGAGAVVLYAYLNFLLFPQVSRVARAFGKAGKLAAELKNTERDVSGIGGLKKQVAVYRDKIDSYESILPAEQEIPKLLEGLSEMAKKANVKIVAITPIQTKQEPQANQAYQEMPILINARSGYHELGRFLNSLENTDRFMKVVDISIKENKATPKKHDVEILVLTYMLLENK